MSFIDILKSKAGSRRSRGIAPESEFGNQPGGGTHLDTSLDSRAAAQNAVTLDMNAMHTLNMNSMVNESSIISEAAPSELAGDFSETRIQGAEPAAAAAAATGLPFLGHLPVPSQQRALLGLVVAGVLGLLLAAVLALNSASRGAAQTSAAGQALMQSQRLAKAVNQASLGNAAAFAEMKDAAEVLGRSVGGLSNGNSEVAAVSAATQELLAPVLPLVERAEKKRRRRAAAAKEPDANRPGPAHHQPAIFRHAGNGRNDFGIEAAARCHAHRDFGGGPSGDAHPAHRQERQRVPHP